MNIADTYMAPNNGYIGIAEWDEEFITSNIIGWHNENIKGRYFIALFNRLEDRHIKLENCDSIHFINKKDAAAFKMYFK